MSLLKCKMCGGSLEITADTTVATCEYCGSTQTIPSPKDENLHNLYNRANMLRIKSEFDKAEQLYEKIIQTDDTQAEAYWGLILCKYGIEYVEDPKTFARIPTCHRTSFDSIIADEDYKSALRNADMAQRAIYEKEAQEIDRIQKEILALAQKEEPYDVFICYKETDESGKRTQDSVIANDIYHQLTQEGFKVFYAAITLEDKLGSAYEPCIFAALNSASVMLVVGTKPEYFEAVWVKNEWSRYLRMMKENRGKLLIPCYRGMDAYELPEEFAHLQAQDMSKIGFINDIVRGIKKVLTKSEPAPAAVKETVMMTESAANIDALLKRAFMFLEDSEWNKANEYCEKVLDQDPENAQAYLGKLMAELKVKKTENLKHCANPFDSKNNYQKAIRFADGQLKTALVDAIDYIKARNEEERLNGIYNQAQKAMSAAKREEDYKKAAEQFKPILQYKDSANLAALCLEKAKKARDIETRLSNELKKKRESLKKLKGILNVSEQLIACIRTDGSVAACSVKATFDVVNNWENIVAISQSYLHNIGLRADGTVVACHSIAVDSYRGQCEVDDWQNIIAITCGNRHTVGLRADGTVVACGDNRSGQCKVNDWRNIIAIACGSNHTVGLRADGTVVACGENGCGQCEVENWRNIIAITCGSNHTVGLRADGTVAACGGGNHNCGQCNVEDWKDIVTIDASDFHTVGLRADGTVIACGGDFNEACNVDNWRNIVAIAATSSHTVGLRSDGTVVARGKNDCGQCDVKKWRNIVAIAASSWTLSSVTVGLRADGTVVACGDVDSYCFNSFNGQNWKLFNDFAKIEEERQSAQGDHERRAAGVCRYCGGEFKGLFTKKCVNCGQKKDY